MYVLIERWQDYKIYKIDKWFVTLSGWPLALTKFWFLGNANIEIEWANLTAHVTKYWYFFTQKALGVKISSGKVSPSPANLPLFTQIRPWGLIGIIFKPRSCMQSASAGGGGDHGVDWTRRMEVLGMDSEGGRSGRWSVTWLRKEC